MNILPVFFIIEVFGSLSPTDSTRSPLPADLVTWWLLVKAALALAAVLVLIWLALTALRRMMGSRCASPAGVKLLGGIPLGPRRSLQFILIGRRLYILGATEHHLNLLDRIDDPEIIDELVNSRTSRSDFGFAKLLTKLRAPSSKPEPPE